MVLQNSCFNKLATRRNNGNRSYIVDSMKIVYTLRYKIWFLKNTTQYYKLETSLAAEMISQHVRGLAPFDSRKYRDAIDCNVFFAKQLLNRLSVKLYIFNSFIY